MSGCRFESYVDYALDVPMYFVYRKKHYVDCSGLSFRVCEPELNSIHAFIVKE